MGSSPPPRSGFCGGTPVVSCSVRNSFPVGNGKKVQIEGPHNTGIPYKSPWTYSCTRSSQLLALILCFYSWSDVDLLLPGVNSGSLLTVLSLNLLGWCLLALQSGRTVVTSCSWALRYTNFTLRSPSHSKQCPKSGHCWDLVTIQHQKNVL